jgi:hypothetical protein
MLAVIVSLGDVTLYVKRRLPVSGVFQMIVCQF